MAKDAIDFSRPFDELFAGGGSFFPAGLYEVLRSRFTLFDFKKGPGNDSLCFFQQLQPLNADGEKEGDPVERYWPVGGKLRDGTVLIEAINPVKGEKGCWGALRFTEANKHDTLYKTSEFATFMQYAHKNEVDMDAVGNDITAFDGMVMEYGIVTVKNESKSQTAVEVAENSAAPAAKKDTKDVVIITGVPKKKKKGGEKKKAKEEEEDEAPAPKKGGKKKGPETILATYLEDVVLKEVKADDSADWMGHKLSFARYLAKELELDADEVKACMAVYNDREEALPAVLETVGLTINKAKEFVLRKG